MNNEKGMTLVELSVAMIILMIIGGVIIQFLFSSTGMFQEKILSNEQIIIIDHVRYKIEEEVRYIEYMYLKNGPRHTAINDYKSLEVIDSKLLLESFLSDGSIATTEISSSNIVGTHTFEVTFESVADAVLQVTLLLDSGEPYERTESFTIRLLNMELYNNAIEKDTTSSSKLYFK